MSLFEFSHARVLAVCAVAGLAVTATAVTTQGAHAATLRPAGALAPAAPAKAPAKGPAKAPAKGPAKKACSNSGESVSADVTANLSSLHATGSWKENRPANVTVELKGEPSLTLDLGLSGDVNCEKDLPGVTIPIGETSLKLKLAPELDFSAHGEVHADFTWTESVDVGFSIKNGKFVRGARTFTASPTISFTGNGNADMRLNLNATVETAKSVVGVTGTIGPEIKASVTDDNAEETPCWNGDYQANASFVAKVSAGWFHQTFHSPVWQLGSKHSFKGCLSELDE